MTRDQSETRFDAGFTLIELLVVIVVLGILAAVVVFAIGGITDQAGENACAIDRRIVMTAVEAYEAETGNTASMAALVSADWLETASVSYGVSGNALAGGDC